MFCLNKILTCSVILSFSLGFCCAETRGVNIFDQEDQKNFDIDQIQNSLKEYVTASKKYVNNPLGWSALNYAVEVKDFQSALILATHCKNINQKDALSKTAPYKINAIERLFYITHEVTQKPKKYPSEVELQLAYVLLDRGINVTNSLECLSPLSGACWFDIDDLIIRLTELGANVNDGSGTPLYYLIENGNLNMARYLIANGANLKAGRVFFEAAISSQKNESIDFLIELGVDLVAKNQIDYLSQAFPFLKKEIHSISDDSNQSFPALEIFCRLLELGADPNFCFTNGLNSKNYEQDLKRCSLWLALELPSETNTQYFYKSYVIQVLLDHGASIP